MTATPPTDQSFFGLTINTSALTDRLSSFRRSLSKRVLLLEFGATSLTFTEAKYTGVDIEFSHLKRVALPAKAIERGVPSEPEKMAALIQSICKEEKIHAHRTVVVLPPEAAFTKWIDMPAELSSQQAWDYVKDPNCGLQIPIPLQQTDFDILPIDLPLLSSNEGNTKPYLLMSVPQKLVDQILDTLEAAELELRGIELGFIAQLRLIAGGIDLLKPTEIYLVLELLPECTHLTVAAASGPVSLLRLAAVREFPAPDVANNQIAVDPALGDYGSAEAITLADEKYLPISELDLRVLIGELRDFFKKFAVKAPGFSCKSIYLTGVNSAHPKIAELLSSALDLPVEVIRPLGAEGVGNVLFSQPLLHQSLGRLLGSGLSIMPNDVAEDLSFAEYEQEHSLAEEVKPKTDLIAPTASSLLEDHHDDSNDQSVDPIVDVVAEELLDAEDVGGYVEDLEEEQDLEVEEALERDQVIEVEVVADLAEEQEEQEEGQIEEKLVLGGSDDQQEEKLVLGEFGDGEAEQDLEAKDEAVDLDQAVDLEQAAVDLDEAAVDLDQPAAVEPAAVAEVVGDLEDQDEAEEKLVLGEAEDQDVEIGSEAEVEEVINEQALEEEEWPSINRDALVEQELKDEEPLKAEVVGDLEDQDEAEEKLVLGEAEDQDVEIGSEQELEAANEKQEKEEDWPSIKRDALVEQELKVEQPEEDAKLIFGEAEDQDVEIGSAQELALDNEKQVKAEEWPSITRDALVEEASADEELEEEKLALGELSYRQADQDQDQKKDEQQEQPLEEATEANAADETMEEEPFPLGELRFSGDEN